MRFSSESALQAFLHKCLGGQREVILSAACRIDLRTDEFDIEVKLVLTSSAMDKAAGQLARYAPYSGGRKLVIAGCAPNNFDMSIRRKAQSFRDAGYEVWFVDRDPVFQEAYQQMYHTKPKPIPPKLIPLPMYEMPFSVPSVPVPTAPVQAPTNDEKKEERWENIKVAVGVVLFFLLAFHGPLMILGHLLFSVDTPSAPADERMDETRPQLVEPAK